MNILTLFAAAAVFSTGVFGDGHGDSDVPSVRVHADIENGLFKFRSEITQNFPDSGEMTMPKLEVTLTKMNASQASLSDVRVFSVWSEISNCSTFDPDTAQYIFEYTNEIQMENFSAPNASRMTVNPDPADTEPYIFPVMYSTVVLQVNGVNYCLENEVEDENMKKIRIIFPPCSDFTTLALRETIHEIFDIDMKRVFVGKNFYENHCYYADVYFQYAFEDPTILHKMRTALSSKFGLGRFSGNDMCMTNVRDTFITDMALRVCYMSMMANNEKETMTTPLPTCAGVSSELAQQYRERIKKYDCLVAEYAKKYGIKTEGCMKSQQQTQQKDQGCTCASSAEAVVQNQMRVLLEYVQLPLYNSELYEKKQELSAMLTSTQMFDQAKFEQLAMRIKTLEAEQMDYYFKSFFGFCIIAGHGDAAMAKLTWARDQGAAGVDAEDILKQLMREAINYYLGVRSESGSLFMNQSMSMKKDTIKMKAKMLLGLSDMCSTMEERQRVWNTLMNLTKSFAQHVEMFNEMMDNEMISNATRTIQKIVEENPEEIAKKMFLVLFSPMEVSEDDMAVQAVMGFFNAVDENKMSIGGKIRSMLEDASVEDLMGLQIILMTPDDTRKQCDLSSLVAQVQPSVDDMSDDIQAPEPERDTGREYDDYSRYYGRGEYERSPRRERMPPRRRYDYNRGYERSGGY